MCSTWDHAALPTLGFPIRESAGHWLFSASPRLIAAVHALHRLLVPRHPPCALTILTDTNACGDRGNSQASHHVGQDLTAFSRSMKSELPLWNVSHWLSSRHSVSDFCKVKSCSSLLPIPVTLETV